MPRRRKRSVEPIGPANIPGERLDPKLPDDGEIPPDDQRVESEDEQHARESEKAFDQALTRIPPG